MYYRDFKKSNPPPYFGEIDGIVVEEWVMQMEKTFEAARLW